VTMTRPTWVVRVVYLSQRGMVSNSGSVYQREGGWLVTMTRPTWVVRVVCLSERGMLVTVAVPTREGGMVSDNDKAYLGSKSGVPIRESDGW
jgi:hypothetical protein